MNAIQQESSHNAPLSGEVGENPDLYAAEHHSRYQGAVIVADNEYVRAIKRIKKIRFSRGSAENITHLLEITNSFLEILREPANKSLKYVEDLKVLIALYNAKNAEGKALLEADDDHRESQLYKEREMELGNAVFSLNYLFKEQLRAGLAKTEKKKRKKKVAQALAFPLWGCFGLHKFYLGQWEGVWYFFFCWTLIPFIASLVDFLKLRQLDQEGFDAEYNKEYLYYRDFPQLHFRI